MRRHMLITAATLVLGLGAAAPAIAHALLRVADPAVGSTVTDSPKQLSLTFSEAVEPAFCRVAVTDPTGKSMAAAPLHADPHDSTRLLLPLKPLPSGGYTVTWHAVSVDTHKTEGHFHFAVMP